MNKALNSERSLKRKAEKTQIEQTCLPPSIRIVSTFGSDSDLVNSVRKFEPSLSRTRSFSEGDISGQLPSSLSTGPLSSTPTHHLSVQNTSARRARSASPNFSISRISSNSSNNRASSISSAPSKNRLFQFVKKTGPSLRNRLVNVKNLALKKQFCRTSKCGARNCKCCKMISDKATFTYKDTTVKAAGGSCSSYNRSSTCLNVLYVVSVM